MGLHAAIVVCVVFMKYKIKSCSLQMYDNYSFNFCCSII